MADSSALKAQKLNGIQWGILVTVMIMFFFAPTFGSIGPTYSLYPDAFGITPAQVSWLSSISAPLCMVAGLLCGTFLGTKISYRACAIFATAVFTFFGGLPFLWQSIPWGMLLLSRLLFGLGVGCFNPLVQSVITHMFRSETARAAWIGIINVVFNLGAMLSNQICGALAANGWQNAYAFYLFCIIPFILSIIFIRDKEILTDADKEELEKQSQAKREGNSLSNLKGIPGIAAGFIITFTLCTIATGGFRDYMTIAMGNVGLSTTIIGTIFSVYSFTGMIAAALNIGLWRLFKTWNFPLAFICLFLGYACCMIGYHSSAGSLIIFFVAAIIMGFGRTLGGISMPMVMSVTVAPSALTLAISLQEVCRNLGSFLSAPWLNTVEKLFGQSADAQMIAYMALTAVAAVIACVLAAKASKRIKAAEAAEAAAAEDAA